MPDGFSPTPSEMMKSLVKTELHEGVGRITLNRPEKRNALTRQFVQQLNDAIAELKSNAGLRVLVIQSAGPVFCAGMDLSEMQDRAAAADGVSEWKRDSEIYCRLLTNLYSLPVPTAVAVQGPALAGGLGLILACDLVVASHSATFGLPEPKRGITAAMVTPLLIHRVGAGSAGQLLVSGENLSANRAFQIGLCYDVVEPSQLEQRIHELVKSVLSGSQQALATTKRHLADCSNPDLISQLQQSMTVSAEARQSTDAREGLAAFLQKRKPKWDMSTPT